MRSSLATILANWFVASKENLQLSSTSKPKSVFYARYVDDIFVLIKNSCKLNSFFHKMNTLHSNLQFILLRSTDSRLLFLYIEVKLTSNKLHTCVHIKSTYTNLVMQYTSGCLEAWKIGLTD